MGLRQEQHTPAPAPASAEPPPTTRPRLPREALELASTLFDYARHGATAELQQYITAGIPVNLTNHKGDTLLMLAAYHGHIATVQMLVGAGADIDALNDRGQSIVAGAVFKGETDIVRFLATQGADLAAGQPNAIECAHMFRRDDLLAFLGVEEGGGDSR